MIILFLFLSFLLGIFLGFLFRFYISKIRNESIWKEIFENVSEPISILNNDGRIIAVNQSMQKFLGKTVDEIKGKYCHTLIHNNKEHIDGCVLIKSKHSLQREEMELEKDGRIYFIAVDPVIKKGKIKYFFHLIKDITLIKQIEFNMKEEKRKYETLVDNLPGFVYRCANDKNWTMQYISQGCELVTGYKSNEFINNAVISFNDIIVPKYQEYLWNKWQKVLANKETFEDEYEIITKNGEIRWVWERGRGIYDSSGNLLFLEGFITDITDRKNILNALLESEEKFRNLANTTSAAIFIYQDNKFVFLNQATEKITGFTQEELFTMNFWDVVHPDHREMVKERGQRRLAGEPMPNTYEFKILRKDGEERWIKFSGAFISQYQGKPAAIATAFDITDMIDAQNKLQEFIAQLEESERQLKVQNEEYISINEELTQTNQRIQRLNEELVKAKEKAEASDRLKSTFLNNISHEIRTPLNAILGFTDLLAKRIYNDEKALQYIEIVQASGKHLLSVITNIINTATIEAGEERVHYHKVNINQLTETVIKSLKPLLAKKRVEIIFQRISEDKSWVLLDETKINQVLINLINNAIKFTERGTITVSINLDTDKLKIVVKDTGIGIAEDVLPYIFERFIQVGDVLKKHPSSGMGLGLSIVKSYVKLMGGEIEVKSEVGMGSEFIVWLPYMPVELISDEKGKERTISYHIPSGKKILIVEDISDNAHLIREYLFPYNLQLLFASNGREAIELVKNNPDIDVILMDIKMPEMNGYEACKHIASIVPNIIVIGLTAFSQEEEKEKMQECGMKTQLTKPITKDDLLKVLEKYLN
ncbi:MAG: PAS domain S-box protein [Bacteroidales bacterium]|nr:PAS domain S-box protein [Bacteroidales bacterium]